VHEFEKAWQEINAIQKRDCEKQEQLRAQQKETELSHQKQVEEQKLKESKILSTFDFVQNFALEYLRKINQEFFSNKGTIKTGEEKTDRHYHEYETYEMDGDCGKKDYYTARHKHIVLKLGVTLLTENGNISVFAPLKEYFPTYDYKNKKSNWNKLTSKDIPLENVYVDKQCHWDHEGISLEQERDEIVKQVREQVLSLIVSLKTPINN
jgi:hypothetical protein